jgi:putative transposase
MATRADHEGLQISRTSPAFHSIHDPVANLFHIPGHDIPSDHHRELRAAAMKMWNGIARLQIA